MNPVLVFKNTLRLTQPEPRGKAGTNIHEKHKKINKIRDFSPRDPVVKTLRFHCRGCGFDRWSGGMPCGLAKKYLYMYEM